MVSKRSLTRFYPLLREYYVRNFSTSSPSTVSAQQLQNVLAKYDEDVIFVHVGLSDINAALSGDPYQQLYSVLDAEFESILTPGFTPSFRKSGVYHKQFSRPQFGMFPVLFLDDAEYRTDDAIHSILVAGGYRFDTSDHHTTFSEDGCWGQLDRDNVLIANIGTNRLVSTQYHYISCQAEAPYQTAKTYSGVVVLADGTHETVDQVDDAFSGKYSWNRWKMERYLEKQGVLERADMNGLKLSLFHARDMRRALEPRIAEDPYYMVT